MAIKLHFDPSAMEDDELALAIAICSNEQKKREHDRIFAKKKEDIADRFNALLHEYAVIRAEELDNCQDIPGCYCQDEEDSLKDVGSYLKPVYGFMIDRDGDLMVVTDDEFSEHFGWKQG